MSSDVSSGVSHASVQELSDVVRRHAEPFQRVREQLARVIVGQESMVQHLLVGLLADGHLLLEGLPGLAKTTAIRALSQVISTEFQRIQFTPDLLPADILGTQIYQPQDASFVIKRGPIFSNLILADEINRAPAKVQSALLEAMQERQVTIGDQTFPLAAPFLVLATQNPIEQEGTYPLPEAQVDRFMLKLRVGYPSADQERTILERFATHRPQAPLEPVLTPDEITAARRVVDDIYMDDRVKNYIIALVQATRVPAQVDERAAQWIEYGASPRATINLALASRAVAFLNQRGYVTPQDVKDIALEVLRHRVLLSYEAEAESLTSDDVVTHLLDHVEVP